MNRMLPQSVTRHIVILAVGLVLTTCTGTGSASDVSSDHSKRAVKDASANDSNDGDHGHGVHVVHLQFDYVSRPLILTVFLVAVVLIKIGFHRVHLLRNHVPESCVLVILGVIVGAILHASEVDTSDFFYLHPTKFFLFLLPPCILEASYELHDVVFFQNLGTILLYAVVGTLLNFIIIGCAMYGLAVAGMMGSAFTITLAECFVFSSLIVAVDPVAVLAIFQEVGVNNVLYFLVFGESLLNDAVTVVLYNTMIALSEMKHIPVSQILLAVAAFFTVSLGGLTIGILFGIVTSFVTRFTKHVRVVEPLEMLSMAYCSYITAELFHFSGIISMIGCGLIQVHYAFHNISQNSATTIKYFTKMLSTTCDCIIFMFLGIALVRDDHAWNWGFVTAAVILCLLVRFLVTMSLTFFANHVYRDRYIDRSEQFIMSYGGLRGAVAFCLVALLLDKDNIVNRHLFQTTVFVVVIFTVFVQGITIKPLVALLKIGLSEEKVLSLYQEITHHVSSHALAGIEEIIGHIGHNRLQAWLEGLDYNLKKVLQRDPLTNDEVIMELYREMSMQQHYETIYGGRDMSSSNPLLYRPEYDNEPVDDDAGVVDAADVHLPYDPRFLKRMASISSDEVQARYRKSLPVVSGYSPSSSPAARRRLLPDDNGRHGDHGRHGDDGTPGSPHPADTKRRRFSRAASMAFRKSIDGTHHDAQEELDADRLRSLLAKTSAANAFLRHTNRNLEQDENSELMHHLHEKQRRHERYMHDAKIFSPSGSHLSSRVGSAENIDRGEHGAPEVSRHLGDERKRSSAGPLLRQDSRPEHDPHVRGRRRTLGPALSPGPSTVYVPKFRPHRASARPGSQRQQTLEEVAEESPEQLPSAEHEDVQSKRASAPVHQTPDWEEKKQSAPPRRTPDREDKKKSPEESIVLLSNEQPSSSPEPEDDANMPRSLSQKGRGKFQRQDESIV